MPAPGARRTTSTDARKFPSLPFGLALVPGKGDRGNRLLVADGLNGTVDVYDADFQKVDDPGLFVDPKIAETGLLPYNVAFLKDRVYVAYADPEPARTGERSACSRRTASSRSGWSPTGMAACCRGLGAWRSRPSTGASSVAGCWSATSTTADQRLRPTQREVQGHPEGRLRRAAGQPGLWGIAFGNGVIGTPNTLIFAAGIGNDPGDLAHTYEHGLIGLIEPAGKEDADDD